MDGHAILLVQKMVNAGLFYFEAKVAAWELSDAKKNKKVKM